MWVYVTTVNKWNGYYIYVMTLFLHWTVVDKIKKIYIYNLYIDNDHAFELIRQVWLGINIFNYLLKYMIELVRFTWISHKNVKEYTFYLLSEWKYIWAYSIWSVTSDMASFRNTSNSKKIRMAVSLLDTFFNIHCEL